MIEVERLADWLGKDVVDPAGERAGKLEEIYLGGDDPVVAEVKAGGLRRKTHLVPLDGATVGRDFLRVRYPAAQIGSAPQGSGEGSVMVPSLNAVAAHYELGTWDGGELEGSRSRAERLAALEEAEGRAQELEQEEHRQRARADQSVRASEEAAAARAEAEAEADRARRGG